MKEDKENTRPKERKVEIKCEAGEKTEKSKEKKEAMTKVPASCVSPCYKHCIMAIISYNNTKRVSSCFAVVYCKLIDATQTHMTNPNFKSALANWCLLLAVKNDKLSVPRL